MQDGETISIEEQIEEAELKLGTLRKKKLKKDNKILRDKRVAYELEEAKIRLLEEIYHALDKASKKLNCK